MGAWDAIKQTFGKTPSGQKRSGSDPVRGGYSGYDPTDEGNILGDPAGTKEAREHARRQAAAASAFAGRGEREFAMLGADAHAQRQYMEDIARGRESVSAMQLKSALGQNVAGQQAMAASARPGQGAMAARTAAMQAGRMGAGLAGQQAIAGIQERQSAQAALNEMLLRQRQQELMAALQSRSTSVGALQAPGGATGQEKQLGVAKGLAQMALMA